MGQRRPAAGSLPAAFTLCAGDRHCGCRPALRRRPRLPNFAACKSLGLDPASTPAEIVAHPKVRATFQVLLDAFAGATGRSSRRITRLILLSEPASAAAGELTDKQALNAQAILANRAGLLPGLFSATPPAQVIIAAAPAPAPAEHRQDVVIAK